MYEKYYNIIIICERDALQQPRHANFLIYVILLFEIFFSRLPGDDVFIVFYYCVLYLLLILHVHYYIAHNIL